MANSVDPDQTAPIGAVCSGSTLFASILNSSVLPDSYLQHRTSADDIFRSIFFGALRVKYKSASTQRNVPSWIKSISESEDCFYLSQQYNTHQYIYSALNI